MRKGEYRTSPTTFWGKVMVGACDACWPWMGRARDRRGYGLTCYQGRFRRVPRLAWELTYGPIPIDGRFMYVCHRCDNPSCCNPSHLFLGTAKDNKADSVAKDRHARGERSGRTILTDEIVRKIRSEARATKSARRGLLTGRQLAAKYGVSFATIRNILDRDTWKHVV